MTTNNAVNVTLSGQTGTVNFVGSTAPTLTTPLIVTGIFDSNNHEILSLLPAAGTIVNFVSLTNSITTVAPAISVSGSDTNISLTLNGKGNLGVQSKGRTSGTAVTAGYIGESTTSTVLAGAGVTLSTTIAANVTSISLAAGNWLLFGNVGFSISGSATSSSGWISTTSATAPDSSQIYFVGNGGGTLANNVGVVPSQIYNFATTTTVYLSAQSSFTTGTTKAYGNLNAIRIS